MVAMTGEETGEFFMGEATGLREAVEAVGYTNEGAVAGPYDAGP